MTASVIMLEFIDKAAAPDDSHFVAHVGEKTFMRVPMWQIGIYYRFARGIPIECEYVIDPPISEFILFNRWLSDGRIIAGSTQFF
jgi:hypothetical protein